MSRTSVVLDIALEANLKALARKHGVSMGSVLRSSLINYLKKHQMDAFKMPSVNVDINYKGETKDA